MPDIWQIYAQDLFLQGGQPFPVGGFHRTYEAAQEEVNRLKRLSDSPAYPLHRHAFTIRKVG